MTEKQREASRLNGNKSNGPVTAEGKRRSSLNARRHQLAAEDLVLDAEEMEDFDRMFSAYLAELQPRTEIETDLVEEMAAAKWRERRCWRLQKTGSKATSPKWPAMSTEIWETTSASPSLSRRMATHAVSSFSSATSPCTPDPGAGPGGICSKFEIYRTNPGRG